jgi:glycosyltransferase involved in cell wall biosynthesis
MASVVVAVPTFRRPQSFKRLLESLARLETSADVTVVVADNDREKHEGADVCATLRAEDYRWPLEYFIAPKRGIANVRNALVEHALGHECDFIAMLDDDEWPDPLWLDTFLRAQQATGADALHGCVLREFETKPGLLAAHCDGIAPMHGATGPVGTIPGTGNIIFSRACFEDTSKPWFDAAFALSGGEDGDFLERLRRQGKRFAWCDEAVAHAWVPATRGNLKWALARAYSVGNSDMRVFLKYPHTATSYMTEIAKIAGALLLSPVLFVILGIGTNRAVGALRKLFRAAGKIAAFRGRHYQEYSVIHGK